MSVIIIHARDNQSTLTLLVLQYRDSLFRFSAAVSFTLNTIFFFAPREASLRSARPSILREIYAMGTHLDTL